MALTDHCDIFLSVLEAGVNRVVLHVRRQWPSLFNYGTAAVAQNPQLLCKQINAHPIVTQKGNPIITVMDPAPVVGTLYGIDYCAQLTEAAIDFSPGNVFTLPPPLVALGAQQLAVKVAVCGGLACPPSQLVDQLPVKLKPAKTSEPPRRTIPSVVGHDRVPADPRDDTREPPLEVIRTDRFNCTCLEAYVVAGAIFKPDDSPEHVQHIIGRLDGIEIVDITPDELESALECYGALVIKLFLFPTLALETVKFAEDDVMGLQVAIEPVHTSAALPNNPAIEQDLLKAFLKLNVSEPPPSTGGGGGGAGGGPQAPDLATGVDRARTRSGPFDATIAMSQPAITVLFNAIRDKFTLSKSDEASFGPFTMGYAIGIHLAGGSLELRDDGTVRVKELDIKWDTAKVWLGIDIPEICVGGFCIIPNPFGGCLVRAPKICVFSAKPDIGPVIDIGGLITSEVSVTFRPVMRYSTNHPSSMNAWDAKAANKANRWVLIADVISVDIDLFDIADIVGDLLHNALESAVDNLLGGLPGWAKDLILAILGPVIDFIADLIDLPDDIGEWIADKLGVSFGLFNLIAAAILDHVAKDKPLFNLQDPLPIESKKNLIDAMIPIEFLGVRVNSKELIVEGDIGG